MMKKKAIANRNQGKITEHKLNTTFKRQYAAFSSCVTYCGGHYLNKWWKPKENCPAGNKRNYLYQHFKL